MAPITSALEAIAPKTSDCTIAVLPLLTATEAVPANPFRGYASDRILNLLVERAAKVAAQENRKARPILRNL
jgi:hypothetical protein